MEYKKVIDEYTTTVVDEKNMRYRIANGGWRGAHLCRGELLGEGKDRWMSDWEVLTPDYLRQLKSREQG